MTTAYLHPVISTALAKAEQKLGDGAWVGTNAKQNELVVSLPDLRKQLADVPAGLLEAIGSTDAEVINAWLAERGYSIRLSEFGPDDIGVAAALDVSAIWSVPGHAVQGLHNREPYPAVLMSEGFRVYAAGPSMVVQPEADTKVLMVMAPDLETGLSILREKMLPMPEIGAVTFPMVDHDAEVDMSWLIGLRHGGATLTQAFAQAKLRINQFGARAKAAVAAAATRGGASKSFRIDGPFVIAFMHNDTPLVAFHVTPEAWKRPPDLGGAKPIRKPGRHVVETW